ncbi:MAG TPA: hypothetical protein VGR35_21945 [Tepidisphaeraceae bacterium]|nr:hypothetical protein [Tepidisphaeraceae bacterium]
MSEQQPHHGIKAQGERFAKLMKIIERKAREARVSPEEYLVDILEGIRPRIDPTEMDAPDKEKLN